MIQSIDMGTGEIATSVYNGIVTYTVKNNIYQKIFSLLAPSDLENVALVSKKWRSAFFADSNFLHHVYLSLTTIN